MSQEADFDNKVEIDLFPKFVGSDGLIWGIGPKAGKTRKWVSQSIMEHANSPELTEEQQAAILFLKFWKLQMKQNHDQSEYEKVLMEKQMEQNHDQSEHQEDSKFFVESLISQLKGYHVALAVESVSVIANRLENEPSHLVKIPSLQDATQFADKKHKVFRKIHNFQTILFCC